MNIKRFFTENPRLAIGFSGGCDSSYLLYIAKKYGADVKPYFVKTAFQPEFELKDAERLAKDVGVDLAVLEADIFQNADIIRNGADRCYFCKKIIFGALVDAARKDGYSLVADGTNASDDAGDRPGMRALSELAVRSPLRECGLTKAEVRSLSKEAGLFTWDKPAYACLATRCPAGEEITAVKLKNAENAENVLFSLGFTNFRVRLPGNFARIQLPEGQMAALLERKKTVLSKLTGFDAVLLDLMPRTGE